MIRRRAAAAGIATKLGNHSFRATEITAYLKNGGTLEKAASMANHNVLVASPLLQRLSLPGGGGGAHHLHPLSGALLDPGDRFLLGGPVVIGIERHNRTPLGPQDRRARHLPRPGALVRSSHGHAGPVARDAFAVLQRECRSSGERER
jgi:hypothetical protein